MEINWKEIEPSMFEKLVRDLLDNLGLVQVTHLGRPGDENVDVFAHEIFYSPRGRTINERVMIQVKRTLTAKMTSTEFLSIISDATNQNFNHLIIICISGYTSGVKDRYITYISNKKSPSIELWEKEQVELYLFRFPHLLRYFSNQKIAQNNDTQLLLEEKIDKLWNMMRKDWLEGGERATYKQFEFLPNFSDLVNYLIEIDKDYSLLKEFFAFDSYKIVLNKSTEPEINKMGSPILIILSTYSPDTSKLIPGSMMSFDSHLVNLVNTVQTVLFFTLKNRDRDDETSLKRNLTFLNRYGFSIDFDDIDRIVVEKKLSPIFLEKIYL